MPPTVTKTNPLLTAALEYAARGWRVVPLHPRDKKPRPRDWPNATSSDAGVVSKAWREVPTGNVGVALGLGSCLVAVDIDTEAGERIVHDLADTDLPDTLEMTTGKGSRLLYATPPDLIFEPKTIVLKVEGVEAVRFQGAGAQCVMPPSIHPNGKTYQWVEGCGPADREPASMPGWLLCEMTRPEVPSWSDPQVSGPADAYAPGADYNRRGSWDDLLPAHGWRPCGRRGDVRYWTRPGKEPKDGLSATVGHYRAKDGTPALYVFSGSVVGLDAGKCYDLFGAFARLAHRGDFSAAAKALAGQGYGSRTKAVGGRVASGGTDPSSPSTLHPAPATILPEPWDTNPVPLDTGLAVPPFPLSVLPAELADFVRAIAAATNSPPDYAGSAAVGINAGVLGATRNLDLKEGYTEISSAYIGIVAPKGSGKTPAVSHLMAPLVTEQCRRRAEGDKARAFVENVTTSKLANLFEESPRGMLMLRDELSALFGGFNEFKSGGKGSDRQFYLSAWSGSPVAKDRVDPDSDDVFVPHPRLSIVGGIQPRVLSKYTGDHEDGLFDRFLWTFPDPLPMAEERGLTVPKSLSSAWSDALDNLWAIRGVLQDNRERPYFLKLATPGWDVWVEWTRWLAQATNSEEFAEDLRGPAAKLRGYAPRLALALHALHEAYSVSAPTTVLGAEDMERGVILAKYFLAHARRVWMAAGRDDRAAGAKRILRWCKNWTQSGGQTTFTRRDLWRGLRKSFTEIEDTIPPLRWLIQLGWLRYVGGPVDKVGRGVTTTTYEIHPSLVTAPGSGDMGDH